ncbi:PBSX family phage terminase large subunit [Bacillus thuringiensis]|nr:PBSX family phage terminase large subunit [Bacillus cereus]MED2683997.1 PBSX family phage terminase large subunit [Bacillus thuringiensis]HDX9563589.1 PBSX family phage terminase large subunit [Bacillus thuringiensis]HDX9701742.1 PBSX family phage terminase large subunit [Bacillus thuringiensis]
MKSKGCLNVVNILDHMNPNFYDLWLAEQSHIVAKGGRGSMKSSVISLKLLQLFLEDPLGNVICFRKVAKYLSGSVYEQIKWAIYLIGVENQFKFGISPLKITHKATNTAFYFSGVDDPMKLKGMKIARGHVIALFFEEFAEFSCQQDLDIVEDTFLRQEIEGKQVKVFFAYNPPRNPYAQINEWVKSKEDNPNYFIHHSTYLDDEKGFLSKQMVEKIELYKRQDEDYWKYMYMGLPVGLGTNIFNLKHVHKLDSLPDDDPIILIDTASDTGHQVSATTHLCFALTRKQNVILLDTYYYSPENQSHKKAPSELSKDFKEWLDSMSLTYNKFPSTLTIDSAEGALRNQIYNDYGLRLHPVGKKKKVDMIDRTQDLLAQGRFYILDTERNQIFLEEMKQYAWDEKTVKSDDPKPIKENDHCMDAFQYYVMDNRKKLRL